MGGAGQGGEGPWCCDSRSSGMCLTGSNRGNFSNNTVVLDHWKHMYTTGSRTASRTKPMQSALHLQVARARTSITAARRFAESFRTRRGRTHPDRLLRIHPCANTFGCSTWRIRCRRRCIGGSCLPSGCTLILRRRCLRTVVCKSRCRLLRGRLGTMRGRHRRASTRCSGKSCTRLRLRCIRGSHPAS